VSYFRERDGTRFAPCPRAKGWCGACAPRLDERLIDIDSGVRVVVVSWRIVYANGVGTLEYTTGEVRRMAPLQQCGGLSGPGEASA
jgi:hypothetical protein